MIRFARLREGLLHPFAFVPEIGAQAPVRLGRYHAGDIDGAINRLRGALVGDPSSPKLHFMLANMLQRASRWAEAVDEYEAVVELQPAYFPALTRLGVTRGRLSGGCREPGPVRALGRASAAVRARASR